MGFRQELCTLFRDTIISGDVQNKNKIREFNVKVESLIDKNLPHSLYRFRSCNTLNLDALLQKKCYASAPVTFNDPFDSFLLYDDSDLETLHRNVFDVKGMRDSIDKTGNLPDFLRKLWSVEFQELIKSKIQRIPPEFFPLLQSVAAIEAEGKISDIRSDAAPIMRMVQDSSYVACFSEDVESILMWSHYADYHRGFALEYDFTENPVNKDNVQDLFPVLYSSEPYDAKEIVSGFLLRKYGTDLPLPDVNYWIKAVLFKAKEWEYEKEWRIIKQRDSDASLYTSFSLVPSAIYYGSRISDSDRNVLHNIVSQLGLKEYQMYQMNRTSKKYKMVPKPLNVKK